MRSLAGLSLPLLGIWQSQIPGNALQPVLQKEHLGHQPYVYVFNPLFAPISVWVEVNSEGLRIVPAQAFAQVVPPRSRTLLFFGEPSSPQWSYSYNWRYVMGSIHAQPEAVLYDLPFAPGMAFRVSQGYRSSFSHHGELEYALDFDMPQGTPVLASREGTVVAVQVAHSAGGLEPSLRPKANFVAVLHRDGTLAHYAHLMQGGSLVKVGQKVSRGEVLGFSGNTGYSSGPHLHFHVYKVTSAEGGWQTLPVTFSEGGGLQENTRYARALLQPQAD